jgi:hypothetical protein
MLLMVYVKLAHMQTPIVYECFWLLTVFVSIDMLKDNHAMSYRITLINSNANKSGN